MSAGGIILAVIVVTVLYLFITQSDDGNDNYRPYL